MLLLLYLFMTQRARVLGFLNSKLLCFNPFLSILDNRCQCGYCYVAFRLSFPEGKDFLIISHLYHAWQVVQKLWYNSAMPMTRSKSSELRYVLVLYLKFQLSDKQTNVFFLILEH